MDEAEVRENTGAMNLKVDLTELRRIGLAADNVRTNLTDRVMKSAMKTALKPMLATARQEVPIGYKGQKSTLGRGRTKSTQNQRDTTYDRGGATKRDLRIMAAAAKGKNIGNDIVGLVGVSKKRQHVGWRTHFITRGTKRQTANDFLERSYNRTQGNLTQEFERLADLQAKKLADKIGKGN